VRRPEQGVTKLFSVNGVSDSFNSFPGFLLLLGRYFYSVLNTFLLCITFVPTLEKKVTTFYSQDSFQWLQLFFLAQHAASSWTQSQNSPLSVQATVIYLVHWWYPCFYWIVSEVLTDTSYLPKFSIRQIKFL